MIELSEQEIVAFIGRSLLPIEKTSLALRLEVANAELDDLLGGNLKSYQDNPPVQIRQMLAELFGLMASQSESNIASKSVEGFRIDFREGDDVKQDFLKRFGGVIAKFGQSSVGRVGGIRHGRTIYDDF